MKKKIIIPIVLLIALLFSGYAFITISNNNKSKDSAKNDSSYNENSNKDSKDQKDSKNNNKDDNRKNDNNNKSNTDNNGNNGDQTEIQTIMEATEIQIHLLVVKQGI